MRDLDFPKPLDSIIVSIPEKFVDFVNNEHNNRSKKLTDTNLTGMDNINILLDLCLSHYHSYENIPTFEELYRIIITQLLNKGWPIYTTLRVGQEDKDLSIITPYIPCFEKESIGCMGIFAFIEKNGKLEEGGPRGNYAEFNYAGCHEIWIDKEDVGHLDLKPLETVKAWLLYGGY